MTQKEKLLMDRMAHKVKSAERALGCLTTGQRADLLLDNFKEIADSEHAKWILAAMVDFSLISPACGLLRKD